jgi:hypothetical protein
MQVPAATDAPPLFSFRDSVARFLVLSPKGQLFALDDLQIAQDYSKVVPAICPTDFYVATSLALNLDESNLTLVLQPREQSNAYFLTRLPGGAGKKPIKVFEEASEIVETAVNNGRFPVIVLAELHKLLVQARARMGNGMLPAPPIPLPIRYLAMRPSAPEDWLQTMKTLLMLTASGDPDKADQLTDKLEELNTRVKRHMVRRYLVDCLWTDAGRKRIGRMASSDDGASFRTFVSGANDLLEFCNALATTPDGRYEAIEGIANVIPRMVNKMPWTAPTLHIYDEPTRKRFGFKEHYSLYTGLRELSVMGPPILVHQQGVLDSVIPVAVMKAVAAPKAMSQAQARMFPIRKVVWGS